MEQVSKESVNYRAATGDHKCGNCVMFHQNGSCDLVMGVISPEDTCDRWEARVSKSEDLQILAAVEIPKMRANLIWIQERAELLKRAGDDAGANLLFEQVWMLRREAYPKLVKLHDAGFNINPEDFGWAQDQIVSDSLRDWLCKSEQTPYLSEHHAPIGHEGLWHTPNKEHPQKEQLPAYIQNIRNALMRSGHGEDEAHAMAIGAVKRWAAGEGAFGHKGKVTPEVQRAAQEAVAEWERLKGEHSG